MAAEPTRGAQPVGKAEADEVRAGWRMGALGMQVAAEVVAGILLGWLWDRWQGTSIGVVVGAVVGIAVGMWSLIKGALKLNRELDARAPTHGRGRPLPLTKVDEDEGERSWSEEWRDELRRDGNHDDERPSSPS
jgi:F0F1-type ATP synthase assembly protein I